jgi:hypothetical protein
LETKYKRRAGHQHAVICVWYQRQNYQGRDGALRCPRRRAQAPAVLAPVAAGQATEKRESGAAQTFQSKAAAFTA